jgi:hypothetical protein
MAYVRVSQQNTGQGAAGNPLLQQVKLLPEVRSGLNKPALLCLCISQAQANNPLAFIRVKPGLPAVLAGAT